MLPESIFSRVYFIVVLVAAVVLFVCLGFAQGVAQNGKQDARKIPVKLFMLQVVDTLLTALGGVSVGAGFVLLLLVRFSAASYILYAGCALFVAAGVHLLRLRRYIGETYIWGVAIIDLNTGVPTVLSNARDIPLGKVLDVAQKSLRPALRQVLASRFRREEEPRLLAGRRVVESLPDAPPDEQ